MAASGVMRLPARSSPRPAPSMPGAGVERDARANRASVCGSLIARRSAAAMAGGDTSSSSKPRFAVANDAAAVPRRDDRQAPSLRFDLRHAETVRMRRKHQQVAGAIVVHHRGAIDAAQPVNARMMQEPIRHVHRRDHQRCSARSAHRRRRSNASSRSATPLATDAVPTNSTRNGRWSENAGGYSRSNAVSGIAFVRQRESSSASARHAGADQRLTRPVGIDDDPVGELALVPPLFEVVGRRRFRRPDRIPADPRPAAPA